MAKKKLTALVNDMSTLSNSGTSELSVMMPLSKIKFSEDFQSLFELDENKVNEIAEDIKANTYDNSQPIHIWRTENGDILIDGHTRFAAAKKAGLYDIPVFIHYFNTLQEALLYATGLQLKRRNLKPSEILLAVELQDSIKTTGRKPDSSKEVNGKSANKLAKNLGVSGRTIEKARAVNKSADSETKAKIKKNEISINEAYSNLPEVKARKGSKKKSAEFSDEELSDSLEDTSGNPKPVMIHTRKESNEPKMSSQEDNERTLERKKAYELGLKDAEEKNKTECENQFAKGFGKAFIWTLAQILKGRTAQDIYSDPAVADLSPSIISKFVLAEEDEDLVYKLSEK